jgi:hypothetical protein
VTCLEGGTVARDAKVLHQTAGTGAVLLAGQIEPALAISAKRYHELVVEITAIANYVKEHDLGDVDFREQVQRLQNEMADLLMKLADSARIHGVSLDPNHGIAGSADFIDMDE